MESQRSFLIIGLGLVSFLLYQQWLVDYSPTPQVTPQIEQTNNNIVGSALPSSIDTNSDLPLAPSSGIVETPKQEQHLVTITTDTFEVNIDTKGGDVVKTVLLKHDAEHKSDDKFVLLSQEPTVYVAQSGLIGRNGPDASTEGRPIYHIEKTEWIMDGDDLTVPMTYTSKDGLEVTKTFYFQRNKHSIDVAFNIKNTSSKTLEFVPFYQLKQDFSTEEGSMMMPTYRGGAFSTSEESYEHYDLDDMKDEKLNEDTLGGWVGMIQHYFVSAWVPAKDQNNNIFTKVVGNGQYGIIGVKSPTIVIQPGETIENKATLFSGPKNQEELSTLHDTLDLTVDYGMLWFISQILFSLLITIYGFVGNWGIAIILITVFVKMLMYPLTKKQYESMAKMRALQPKMAKLKERFGDDRQKFGQATMELYKKEKVNPMGGCLPLLLQMPIFLALYWVFLESVELRHAPFGLWISDLSASDPYYILPALFGLSMFTMQKLSPSPTTDPMQQKMMLWMPVIFSVFFVMFPAGLVLYWFISNVISILQMLFIYRNIDKKNAAKK
jgi:YidC/Oxa1 family membrane protein insertase